MDSNTTMNYFILILIIVYISLSITKISNKTSETFIVNKANIELTNKVLKLETLVKKLENKDDSIYRNFLNLNPIPIEIRNVGIGGSERYNEYYGYAMTNNIIYTMNKVDKLIRKANVQLISYSELEDSIQNLYIKTYNTPSILPVKPYHLKNCFISPMGYRTHPILNKLIFHKGIDIPGEKNSGVYATANGIIDTIIISNIGYGKCIIINHQNGYKTLYAHLNKINVISGQTIKMGELIGLVGNTGLSTSDHLHYEVHYNDSIVNPLNYIGDFNYKTLNKIYGGG